ALVIEPGTLERLPRFRRRMEWYLKYRPTLAGNIRPWIQPGEEGRKLLSLTDREKLEAVMPRLLDPDQFLSDYGLRSLSRSLANDPFVFQGARVAYEPG